MRLYFGKNAGSFSHAIMVYCDEIVWQQSEPCIFTVRGLGRALFYCQKQENEEVGERKGTESIRACNADGLFYAEKNF